MGNADKFELVTGHGPEPHVDADDHALLYASFIGPGVYRLTGVKTAEIEVTSENEVTISPGMFLIHGRFARVKDQISLPIETGSQGQNRNDLVVAEYSYSGNQTEIDDMELVVVTGTPANPGSETDPSIEDDLTLFDIEYGGSITSETIIQIPLWRVPKEGLTTQDPVALFKDYVDSDQARSSIGQILWTGTWSSGSITVPGLSDYVLFAARLVDSRIWLTGFSARNDSAFRLSSNHISNTPNVFAYALNASRDGDKLTMDIAGYANVLGANVYPSTVCEIVGIL